MAELRRRVVGQFNTDEGEDSGGTGKYTTAQRKDSFERLKEEEAEAEFNEAEKELDLINRKSKLP